MNWFNGFFMSWEWDCQGSYILVSFFRQCSIECSVLKQISSPWQNLDTVDAEFKNLSSENLELFKVPIFIKPGGGQNTGFACCSEFSLPVSADTGDSARSFSLSFLERCYSMSCLHFYH